MAVPVPVPGGGAGCKGSGLKGGRWIERLARTGWVGTAGIRRVVVWANQVRKDRVRSVAVRPDWVRPDRVRRVAV
ncbi:hypothetical protein GCM10027360_11480 [Amycolatopsis echigonensis]